MTTTPYHPPIKRSLAIQGHRTSISLEPLFWSLLKAAAAEEGIPIAQLVTRIDGERIRAEPAPGLAGAIRVWLVARLVAAHQGEQPAGEQEGTARPAPAPSVEEESTET